MARKGWASLSPTYQKRLAAKGVTEQSYTAGASIVAARGHRATPERPGDFRSTAKRLGLVQIVPDFGALDPDEQRELSRLYVTGLMSKGKGKGGKATDAQIIARMDFRDMLREVNGDDLDREGWRLFRDQYRQTFSAAA